jgi:hypothetical protein
MRLAIYPLTPLPGNVAIETALASLAIAQGMEVQVVVCDGLRPHCMLDVYFDRTKTRADDCQNCRDGVTKAAQLLEGSQGISVVDMRSFVDPAEQQHLFTSIDQTADDDLLSFTCAGMPFGRWVQDGLRLAYYGEDWRQLADRPQVTRHWLQSMVTTYLMANTHMERYKPDTTLVLNGLVPCEHVVANVARSKGIWAVTYEGGQQPGTISLDAVNPACFYDVSSAWQQWRDVPLSRSESLRLNQMMTQRMFQGGGGYVYSPSVSGRPTQTVEDLGLPTDRPLLTAFTNCVADTSVFESNQIFARQMDWIDTCITYAQTRPHLNLVIRIHPVEGKNFTLRRSQRTAVRGKIIDGIATKWPTLPPNVRVVDSLDSVSSYDLMQASTVVLAYVSTVGIEATCLGLPVVAAGVYHYTDKGLVHIPDSPEAFPVLVDRLVADPQPPAHAQELARRYMYLWMYRASPTLQNLKVDAKTQHIALINRPLYDLVRGRHVDHDRIVDYLRGDSKKVPPPAPWRPRDMGEPASLAMPAGYHVVIAPDGPVSLTTATVLCEWAARYPGALHVSVLPGPLTVEEATPALINALTAVAPPEAWPEIDLLPAGMPDAVLGDILCRAHALVVHRRAEDTVQRLAPMIGLPVIAVDDLAAVQAFGDQLAAASLANRPLSLPI